jgi:DNA-binding MarR family transcriptional regulator
MRAMKVSDDVYAVQRAYPKIWHACHKRHRKGATSSSAASERDVALLAHLDPARPTSAGALARHLGVQPSTVSASLDDLQRHGYVDRRKASRDRRVVEVHLTRKGRDAVSSESALDAARVEQMLGRLGAAERRAAVAGLELLAQAAVRTRQTVRTGA